MCVVAFRARCVLVGGVCRNRHVWWCWRLLVSSPMCVVAFRARLSGELPVDGGGPLAFQGLVRSAEGAASEKPVAG